MKLEKLRNNINFKTYEFPKLENEISKLKIIKS